MVHTTLTIHTKGVARSYESASFRKIDTTSLYSALETADTVSTGRAFGKAGVGIEDEFETSDGMAATPETKEIEQTQQVADAIQNVVEEKKKRGRKANVKVVEKDNKQFVVDLDSGLTHSQVIEAKMAMASGDKQHAVDIMTEAKDNLANSIFIPELDATGKRSLKDPEVKALGVALLGLGAAEEEYKHFISEIEWQVPEGADQENLRFEFLRSATVEQIQLFINELKGEN